MKKHSFVFNESFVQPILDNGVSKVVQFSFPQGKVLEKHKAPSDILVMVLQGEVQFRTDEEAVVLKTGDMISLEKNITHSIEANEQSVVVLVITPSPATHAILKPSPDKHEQIAGMSHPTVAPNSHVKDAVSPQLHSFVEEHQELQQVLEAAAGDYNADAYAKADNMIYEELNQHFRYEEEILFPLLGKYIPTNAGPIAVMLAEHKIIRENHQVFRKRLQEYENNKQNVADVQQAFASLAGILSNHIMKEDNVLFPMASSVMSEEDQNEVARRVLAEKQKSASGHA